MRPARTVMDWFPVVLASAAVLAKGMAFLLMWTGSVLSVPLLFFVIADILPFQAAQLSHQLFFGPRGVGRSLEDQVVSGLVLLFATALQWYAAGAIVRYWHQRRGPVAMPVQFR